MVKIHFLETDIITETEEGTTILEAARKAGVLIESPCNAVGTCGKCKVRLGSGMSKLVSVDDGFHRLSDNEKAQGYVLACQTRVYGNIDVSSINSNQNKTLKIVSEGQSFRYDIQNNIIKTFDGESTTVLENGVPLGKENSDTTAYNYGLAIDIGTTTLVTALIDVITGNELASVSALNPQSLHAQDVLTRIQFASSEGGLSVMYHGIINELNRMVETVRSDTSVDKRYIYEAVYSGNTTMIHLAANVNPRLLGKYPYTPQITGANSLNALENGLDISAFGTVYLPPIISAYVGPDITSGILAAQLEQKIGTTLFIDIGTNGEMVIAKDGRLCATSTAAGPAFEGMNISCGMRAGKGAIEYFNIDDGGEIEIKSIENSKPVGICGSGLLDIVGELVRVGAIGTNGKLVPPEKGSFSDTVKNRLIVKDGKLSFRLADDVYLTQKDIRQVQLAKGAVRAGVEALLSSKSVKAENVDLVQIAGSFGFHLRAKSLINLGLLPKEFDEKIEFVGNTSKSGAKAFLLNKNLREEMKELVKKIEVVELANQPGFERLFVKSLNF